MSMLSQGVGNESTINKGNDLRRRAESCTFAKVCKVLWPQKTANAIAALAHVSERTAKYWLAGEHEPSARMAAVINNEIFGG